KRVNIILLLITMLVVIGCSNEEVTSDSGTGETKQDEGNTEQTLTYGLSENPVTFDLRDTNIGPNIIIGNQMFETLLKRDENGQYHPKLATDYKQVDDFTWEFKLRDDVTFHNGEPFNAEAVKYSFERYMDPENPNPHVGQLEIIDKVEVVDDYTVN